MLVHLNCLSPEGTGLDRAAALNHARWNVFKDWSYACPHGARQRLFRHFTVRELSPTSATLIQFKMNNVLCTLQVVRT